MTRSKKLKAGDLVTCEEVGASSGNVTHHRGAVESWQRFRSPGGKSWLIIKVPLFKSETFPKKRYLRSVAHKLKVRGR